MLTKFPEDIRLRIRFAQIFAFALEAQGKDVRDWLWLNPQEDELNDLTPDILERLDLRRQDEFCGAYLSPVVRGPVPDFELEVLPELHKRFVLVRVGGMGSHLVKARPFEELAELDVKDKPWIYELEYGSTLASAEQTLQMARENFRDLLGRIDGRKVLFIGHSRGAVVALDLLTDPSCVEFRDDIAGIVSFAGALGGSPAAVGPLAERLKSAGKATEMIRNGLAGLNRLVPPPPSADPFWKELPSLADLPESLRELSPAVRQERLARIEWPREKMLLSIAAVPDPKASRLFERLAGRDLGRRFFALSGVNLSELSLLHDTQVLLRDTQWPEASGGLHLGTVRADHWGMAYGQLLPIAPKDPTPRKALYRAVLTATYERMRNNER